MRMHSVISDGVSERRLNNSLFLMHLATEAYRRRHNLTRQEFLDCDSRYHLLSFISECPDVFDSMTEPEMADELDQYVEHFA